MKARKSMAVIHMKIWNKRKMEDGSLKGLNMMMVVMTKMTKITMMLYTDLCLISFR